jgi:hypothetical protein
MGQQIIFVAQPKDAPVTADVLHARPDDASGFGGTWREALVKYNDEPGDNLFRLLAAWQLYDNRSYGHLAESLGVRNLFILSAGWGLIRSDFLTPYYDITFSTAAEPYKRRRLGDPYRDFCMLPATREEIVFFGGKDYLPLFCSLTDEQIGRRTVFYNSSRIPDAPGCRLRRFHTSTRTNWHYECVNAFLDGTIEP